MTKSARKHPMPERARVCDELRRAGGSAAIEEDVARGKAGTRPENGRAVGTTAASRRIAGESRPRARQAHLPRMRRVGHWGQPDRPTQWTNAGYTARFNIGEL